MLLSVITLVSFTAAIAGYRASLQSAESLFDQNLQNLAYSLSALPMTHQPIPAVESTLVIQLWQNAELISRSENAPSAPVALQESGFGNHNFSGQRWRTYRWQDSQNNRDIMLAQPLAERIAMAEAMAQSALLPLIISTPVLGLLIALTLTRAMSPLKTLSQTLQQREADDLSAITLTNCPAELQPVLDTLNRLFSKVELAFAREKRFSSDAAHELRTPLSVLQVNIHNLMQQEPSLQQPLVELNQSVERMSHVVEQILLLNRTHPDHYQKSFCSLSFNELCQQAISDCYPAIVDRQQTIALEADAGTIIGDAFALAIMLQNIINNASKYSPPHSEILLTCHQQHDNIVLIIEDSGPGIAESQQSRVLDRFYRIGGDQHHSAIIGCGLGMAIVKQIVDLHHGRLSLGRSHRLGGLAVEIQLPRNPPGLC